MFNKPKITDKTINEVLQIYEKNKALIDSNSKEINDEYFKAVRAFNNKGVTDSSVNSALALLCFYYLGNCSEVKQPEFIAPHETPFFF